MTEFQAIAVVGEGCVLPGANTPEELWNVVDKGQITLSEPPKNHWRISMEKALSQSGPGVYEKNRSWCSKGGYIHGFDEVFDSKRYLESIPNIDKLDNLVKWSLYAAQNALTGVSRPLDLKRTGLIMGNLSYPSVSLGKYAEEIWLQDLQGTPQNKTSTEPINRFMSGSSADLVARGLGIKGRVFALDAACASGLYAASLACQRLVDGDLDLVLAGAVNCTDPLFIHVGFCALNAMSRSGQSRPFNQGADGLIPAEGAAFIALKRLDDAIEAGDNILGVIRGSGLANDGRAGGLLSPSSEGQVRAMKKAYKQANLDPETISYVECHATGTLRGDSTEVKSMAQVFSHRLPISSLKGNLGHSITASGIAGIIKVLHTFKHKVIPTTPNAFPLASHVSDSQFYVPEANEFWQSEGPRRAAVNAFGFGGNNAHVLLEEWQDQTLSFKKAVKKIQQDVCIVACALKTNQFENIEDYIQNLRGTNTAEGHITEARIDIRKTGFPPMDLKASLGQQLLMLEVAQQASRKVEIKGDQFGVFIGMGVDPEICRYGLRARLQDKLGLKVDELSSIAPELESRHVLGTMPNVAANRISSSLDARGMSFSISSEDASGLSSLELAIRAIQKGDLNSALVGAVDLGREKVSLAANRALLGHKEGADIAACIVLKSREQAEKDGDTIFGTISRDANIKDRAASLKAKTSGYSHAAYHLTSLVVDTQLAFYGLRWDGNRLNPLMLNQGSGLSFLFNSWQNQTYQFRFVPEDVAALPVRPEDQIFIERYEASSLANLAQAIEEKTSAVGAFRLAIWGQAKDRLRLVQQAKNFLKSQPNKPVVLKGLAFSPKAIEGELACLYTGAASSYPSMGQSLVEAYPQSLRRLQKMLPDLGDRLSWVYEDDTSESSLPYNQLVGSSYLCQIHGMVSHHLLNIKPQSIGGLSSGETNSMFAHGIWSDMGALLSEVYDSGLYQSEMAGDYKAVKEFWGLAPEDDAQWANFRVLESRSTIESLLKGTERIYISIVNSPRNLVLCGYRPELEKVLSTLPRHSYSELGHDLAVHCPPVEGFRKTWRKLHTRPSKIQEDLKVYSNFLNKSYKSDDESVAEALTGQAFETVDLPRLIEKMWDDGIRIFVEHGPRQSLSESIKSILKGKEFLAVAYDSPDSPGLQSALKVGAALWTSGVTVDFSWLPNVQNVSEEEQSNTMMSFPLRLQDPLPLTAKQKEPLMKTESSHPSPYKMKPAPYLSMETQQVQPKPTSANFKAANINESIHTARKSRERPESHRPGPKYSRDELKILAGGTISDVFGTEFKGQDHFTIQVRMPEPPLLLCDRVLGIEGQAKSMSKGTIWTETEVFNDSWYLVNGRMPAGIFIESGQADLLLISWLGIDFHNKGERAYRLLGCELIFHGELPKPGDTLSYEIHVDGHAKHGDVRLFFFHYDCYIDGELRISVRSGQAGFFSKAELASSDGVLWSPETGSYTEEARLDPMPGATSKVSLSSTDIENFRIGRVAACFGDSFAYTETHTRTPKITDGPLRFIDDVQVLDFRGGVKGRGYLRAETPIDPQHWYFNGHFKNDPCMPGTLMAEGCLEAMAIYMTASGVGIKKDGWRFEPMTDTKYLFKCRGQVTPESKLLSYEIFVDEFYIDDRIPTLFAHVLCTVDGRKAFLCERLGLRLVPDYPLTTMREWDVEDHSDSRPVAKEGAFSFDYKSLINCAWGHPQKSFGPKFPFDKKLRTARLPSPPYHFMTRILEAEGGYLQQKAGASTLAAYDIDADAWYFKDNPNGYMPFAVLMEVALQPCGWLATYVGLPGMEGQELLFRNLDGTANCYRPITKDDQCIQTRTTLQSISKMGQIIIVKFAVSCEVAGELVYEMDTAFGFFPEESMINQKGLPIKDFEREQVQSPSKGGFDVSTLPRPIAQDKLLMIDRIDVFEPNGGQAKTGYMRAYKKVTPSDWFFKAHFFQDPVQPGSLGVEAMAQVMQCFIHKNLDDIDPKMINFEPIASQEAIEWHYRGQVAPHVSSMTVDFEASSIVRKQDEVLLYGIGRLWAEGRKIYEAPKLAMRASITSEKKSEEDGSSIDSNGKVNSKLIYDQMENKDDQDLRVVYDIFAALAHQFVGKVHIESPKQFKELHSKPALYLANHQVGIESLLFMTMMKTLMGNPIRAIAKSEHRESVYGQLQSERDLLFGGLSPIGMYFFDRKDQMSIFSCLESFRKDMVDHDMSLLCHVEGTRSLVASEPVQTVSSIFIDTAKSYQIPIVPVRFSGALPTNNDANIRYEYPVSLGAQDIYIGTPIQPDQIEELGLRDAVDTIIKGINRMGPRNEKPNPGDPRFVEMVDQFSQEGASFNQAILWASLAMFSEHEPTVDRLRRDLMDGNLSHRARKILQAFSK